MRPSASWSSAGYAIRSGTGWPHGSRAKRSAEIALAPLTPARLVTCVCAAQVCAQIGAYTWPALLPGFIREWHLTNSEAGWITGVFYAAYTLAVPVLVTLTDRVDARAVYLSGVALTVASHFGFAAFAGLFALLAWRPRGYPGVFEIVIANKAALAILGITVLASADGASEFVVFDGGLSIALVAAYVLVDGWTAWRRPAV